MSKKDKQKTRSKAMAENARIANLEYVAGMIAEITRLEQSGNLCGRAAAELLKKYSALNIKYSK
ncbi:MAG: hypothetical protein LBL21_05385 [Rickettsiales bacterium]|jgi:hypothetical protein|nr:hypothetical protein [Rickettsiales bacterium]